MDGAVQPRSAAELRAHYAAVRRRLWTSAAVRAPAQPERTTPCLTVALLNALASPAVPPEGPVIVGSFLHHLRPLTATDLVAEAAGAFGVPMGAVLGPCREPWLTRPRYVAMWLIRECLGHSLQQIGDLFGRDHTSVIHGLRRVADQAEAGADWALVARHILGRMRVREAARRTGAS